MVAREAGSIPAHFMGSTMLSNFARVLPITLAFEGGAVDDKRDPGGRTNKGVTQRTYDAWRKRNGRSGLDVFKITDAEVSEIYREDFWKPISGDRLAAGVDLATFDAGVNSGPSRALKWLVASVGGSDADTVKKLCGKRLGFMQSLKIWSTFKNGWSKRVAAIEAKGVAWALAASSVAVKPELEKEKATAEKAATKNATGAAGAGSVTTAGGGDAVLNPQHADAIAGWVLGGLVSVGVVVVAFLIIRAVIHKQRAAAYAAEAEAAS